MTWIYIQTSISEGLPVSVIEAGLTGKCVVCTNVGGCAELLANPNAGRRPPAQGRGPAAAPGARLAIMPADGGLSRPHH
jgi:glycosyltransferase involved in cell wall biosynthesis